MKRRIFTKFYAPVMQHDWGQPPHEHAYEDMQMTRHRESPLSRVAAGFRGASSTLNRRIELMNCLS